MKVAQGHHAPSLRQALALILATVLLTSLGLEGVARLAGLRPMSNPFLQDQELGWRWAPGFEGSATAAGGPYTIRISRQGLRDRDYAVPKPAGITRILILGDSVAAGQGVDIDDTFARKLQARLADDFPNLQVINGGTADYNTQQEVLWLERYGLRFEPDLILLAYATNDPRPFIQPPGYYAPLFGVYNFFLQNSAAYGWYLQKMAESEAVQTAETPGGRFRYYDAYWSFDWVDDPVALEQLYDAAATDWAIAWDAEALEANLSHLDRLYSLTSSWGIPFVLLIVPPHAQVAARKVPPNLDFDAPQRRLTGWAERYVIVVIDPLPDFREHSANRDDLYIDHIHLSAKGHTLLAQMIADELGNLWARR